MSTPILTEMKNLAFSGAISLEKASFWFYGLFLAGYFLFPEAPNHYRFYYLFVLLPLLFRCSSAFQRVKASPLFWLLLLYTAYMVVSSFWSEIFDWKGFGKVIWRGFLVISFILVTVLARTDFPGEFRRMLSALVWLAVITAITSILVWYSDHPFPETRLEPVSRMNHPVLASCAYGFFAILALYFGQSSRTQKVMVLYWVAAIILIATVLFTHSRTPIVSLVIAFPVLMGLKGRSIMAVIALLLALLFIAEPVLWGKLLRGMSYRPGIWLATFERGLDHLPFGSGYLSDPGVTVGDDHFDHGHNAYLATLRDGGIMGLGLLLAALGLTMRQAIVLDRQRGYMRYSALLVYALLCLVPDFDRLLIRPKELWLFFWLPIALVMADSTRGLLSDRAPKAAQWNRVD